MLLSVLLSVLLCLLAAPHGPRALHVLRHGMLRHGVLRHGVLRGRRDGWRRLWSSRGWRLLLVLVLMLVLVLVVPT